MWHSPQEPCVLASLSQTSQWQLTLQKATSHLKETSQGAAGISPTMKSQWTRKSQIWKNHQSNDCIHHLAKEKHSTLCEVCLDKVFIRISFFIRCWWNIMVSFIMNVPTRIHWTLPRQQTRSCHFPLLLSPSPLSPSLLSCPSASDVLSAIFLMFWALRGWIKSST